MTAQGRRFYRHIIVVVGLYALLLAVGWVGYVLIEGWSWTDSVYMTVITISTVGFGEIRPLSPAGRVFTGAMIIMGVSTTAYAFSTLADVIVAGEFRNLIGRRRMQNRIDKLRGHFIVCGYGRVGEAVVQDLLAHNEELVLIEMLASLRSHFENTKVIMVEGNATDDSALIQAGIEHAAGICCCLPNDSDNVYVALTARALNPDLTVISRANSPESERKLLIAGVDHVINPYVTSGRRMVRQLVHPNILEFMDVVMHRDEVDILIEEIVISERSHLRDHTISATEVRKRLGANILAVRRPDGETFVNPGVDFPLRASDTLIALGTPEQLHLLATEAEDPKS